MASVRDSFEAYSGAKLPEGIKVPDMPSNVQSSANNRPEDIKNAGVKFDADKLPVHLLPFDALMEITEILAFGAKKYEDRNWERGMDWHRPFRACTTHLWKWFMKVDDGKGPGMDEETGRSHLSHAGACILFMISYELRKIGKDTRPDI